MLTTHLPLPQPSTFRLYTSSLPCVARRMKRVSNPSAAHHIMRNSDKASTSTSRCSCGRKRRCRCRGRRRSKSNRRCTSTSRNWSRAGVATPAGLGATAGGGGAAAGAAIPIPSTRSEKLRKRNHTQRILAKDEMNSILSDDMPDNEDKEADTAKRRHLNWSPPAWLTCLSSLLN